MMPPRPVIPVESVVRASKFLRDVLGRGAPDAELGGGGRIGAPYGTPRIEEWHDYVPPSGPLNERGGLVGVGDVLIVMGIYAPTVEWEIRIDGRLNARGFDSAALMDPPVIIIGDVRPQFLSMSGESLLVLVGRERR